MIDPHGDEWVTIPEAARRVRVREDLIRQWKHRRRIRGHRVHNTTFVHMGDVAAAELDLRQTGPATGRGTRRGMPTRRAG